MTQALTVLADIRVWNACLARQEVSLACVSDISLFTCNTPEHIDDSYNAHNTIQTVTALKLKAPGCPDWTQNIDMCVTDIYTMNLVTHRGKKLGHFYLSDNSSWCLL